MWTCALGLRDAVLRTASGATKEDKRLRAAILLSVAYVSGWAVLHVVV